MFVRSKGGSEEWVFPKGHIEKGEKSVEAAVREVREEAGVLARIVDLTATNIRFKAGGEDVNAVFYLMEYVRDVESVEKRETQWFSFDEALQQLKYEESRRALRVAENKRVALSTS